MQIKWALVARSTLPRCRGRVRRHRGAEVSAGHGARESRLRLTLKYSCRTPASCIFRSSPLGRSAAAASSCCGDRASLCRVACATRYVLLMRSPHVPSQTLRSRRALVRARRARRRRSACGSLFAVYRLLGRWAFTSAAVSRRRLFLAHRRATRGAPRAIILSAVRRAAATELGRSPPCLASTPSTTCCSSATPCSTRARYGAGASRASDVEFEDPQMFRTLPRVRRRAALFIGSHLGNLEVLRAFGDIRGFKVNALVSTRHSPKFNRVLSTVSPRALERMIEVDSLGPDAVIKLAGPDSRAASTSRSSAIVFRCATRSARSTRRSLGRPAPFPEGPFVLASLLACPVYLCFACASGASTECSSSRSPIRSSCRATRRRAALEQSDRALRASGSKPIA